MFQKKRLKQSLLASMSTLLFLIAPAHLTAAPSPAGTSTQVTTPVGWKEYHAKAGNCSLFLPAEPEHISEKTALKLNAILIANHHRETCEGYACNCSLWQLQRLLELAGISLTDAEKERFM